MRLLIVLAIVLGMASCTTQKAELKSGIWRGVIAMQGQQLPFNFEVVSYDTGALGSKNTSTGYKVYLKNAGEKLLLDEVSFSRDTVTMVLHIFDAELRAKVNGGELTGYYIKNFEKNYRLPFRATWGDDYRFAKANPQANVDFTGKYSVTFSNGQDTRVSVGIFRQNGNYVEGTFLNPSGDYRYLEGNVAGDKMWLSTFDGDHAYIFSGIRKNKTTLTGDYWSGKTRHETWVGVENENAALPDLESLTFLKKGYEKLEFSFPDLQGKKISPSDERYKNKVLILQLLGTWCPNCLDETRFLTDWYRHNKDRGVEILGLAYEHKDDFDYARGRVKKMKEKLGIDYDIVIAGTSDKTKASESLPGLNRVIAFPTTIFIGKDGKVKQIHMGFSGPGTGIYHDQYIERFNETVNELLSEKLN